MRIIIAKMVRCDNITQNHNETNTENYNQDKNNNNCNNDDRHDTYNKIITIIAILTNSSNKFIRKIIIQTRLNRR